ncbi:hypothetical protein [Nocardia suismassiliense]|uniref:hypothetical protein n=1 Tax=Nocardia suismassiliense TaxID=2077092 RepID=UPI000D1DF5BC|nr:hypothetical protein [Nocardia suismassiliense]
MSATDSGASPAETFYRVRRRFGTPVAEAYARAEGYAWGWQDARSEQADSAQATTFAHAYALYLAEFLTQQRCFVHSVPRAWQAWLHAGDVAAELGRCA